MPHGNHLNSYTALLLTEIQQITASRHSITNSLPHILCDGNRKDKIFIYNMQILENYILRLEHLAAIHNKT